MTLFWLPLEKLDKRYTILTRKWFEEEFIKSKINYIIIEGKELTSKIETGSFLDCYGTIYYKSSQIKQVAKLFRDGKVKNNDVFFIDDVWMPGIAGIQYMAKMSNIKVYVCGIYHAGSHTPSDDVAVNFKNDYWIADYEKSLLKMCDKVFVGSKFHKEEIENYHKQKFDNIFVTGLAFNENYIRSLATPVKWKDRQHIVLFPHRIHPEKQPELFDKIEKAVHRSNPNIKFVKTMPANLSKIDYYKLIARSKLMFSASLQENFGYAALECATLGCDLLLPKRLSYKEFYTEECFYNDKYTIEDIAHLIIKKVTSNEPPKEKYITKYLSKSIKRIIKEIKMLGWCENE